MATGNRNAVKAMALWKILHWCALLFRVSQGAPWTESERQEEYRQRGHTWPPEKYVPNTEGWKRIFERRFDQVEHVQNRNHRYDSWAESVTAAYTMQNFTQDGFGLTRVPEELVATLRQAVRDGLPTAGSEGKFDGIEGPAPLFISRLDLTYKALTLLKPIHEAWSGVKLVRQNAYGFRLYQNNSGLLMHVDKTRTHVISGILHVDSSDDAEPWPIVIEDFQGNTNEVILTPGDLLLYESAKCYHGRPKRFRGSWYTSVFFHYYPEGWLNVDHEVEGHYGIPPHWNKVSSDPPKYPPLEVQSTTIWEPTCKDNWCALANSVKSSGPGEEGYVVSTSGRFPLNVESNVIQEL